LGRAVIGEAEQLLREVLHLEVEQFLLPVLVLTWQTVSLQTIQTGADVPAEEAADQMLSDVWEGAPA